MKEIEDFLCDYTYLNKGINKNIKIYRRTKKSRIKNKLFTKIMLSAIDERKVIKCDDVVLMDYDLFLELENYKKELEDRLLELKK